MGYDWGRWCQLINIFIFSFLFLSLRVRGAIASAETLEDDFHVATSASLSDGRTKLQDIPATPNFERSNLRKASPGLTLTEAFKVSQRLSEVMPSLNNYGVRYSPRMGTNEFSSLLEKITIMRKAALDYGTRGDSPEMFDTELAFCRQWLDLSMKIAGRMHIKESAYEAAEAFKALFAALSQLLESGLLTREIYREQILSSPHFLELLSTHIEQATSQFYALGLQLEQALSTDQRLEHLRGIFQDLKPMDQKNLVYLLIVRITKQLPKSHQLRVESEIPLDRVLRKFFKHPIPDEVKEASSLTATTDIANQVARLLYSGLPGLARRNPSQRHVNEEDTALIAYYGTISRVLSYILRYSPDEVKKAMFQTRPLGSEEDGAHSITSQPNVPSPKIIESDLRERLNFVERLVELADKSARWQWQFTKPVDIGNYRSSGRAETLGYQVKDYPTFEGPEVSYSGGGSAKLQEELETFTKTEKLKSTFVPEAANWVKEPGFRWLLEMVKDKLNAPEKLSAEGSA